ncbi:SDR family NAD(P)-dependent oxidoreductase [Aquicoccus sp. SCR17]|nr:SDR family NAD(P)-dependent oxidoreductase [Carideicomes alvinocaridis]
MKLTDGIALVTGAGGGLGRELARALAARGMRVAALGRSLPGLEETAAGHDRVFPLLGDVTDAEAMRAAVTRIEGEAPLTLLINNAATYPRRDILDETGESFAETVAVNLGGTVNATRAALDPMVARGFGRILNVATFADVAPLAGASAYSVSKGAQRIFTRALVADLADRFPDIVIGDWMPGMLATRMGIPDGLPPEKAAQWGAELALWHDPALTGTVFEMDREIPPPRSLKGRLKDRLTGQRAVLRRLGSGGG